MCGGAITFDAAHKMLQGPSPRVRGSHDSAEYYTDGRGSIPACAGEPGPSRSRPVPRAVHPRVCGGASFACTVDGCTRGPSPRVRGSLHRVGRALAVCRSIPACAGEPETGRKKRKKKKVHPRVCGGARRPRPRPINDQGPSPRVRGSQQTRTLQKAARGSIPACAGEPTQVCRLLCFAKVHPRVCGGANNFLICSITSRGPSPRVRGSQRSIFSPFVQDGSIPACAGEPLPHDQIHPAFEVHPRVCGGARRCLLSYRRRSGPSPRVRGSRMGVVLSNAG